MRFTKLERPITQFTKTGEKLKTYIYIHELIEAQFHLTKVRDCCRHRLATYKGFVWRYE